MEEPLGDLAGLLYAHRTALYPDTGAATRSERTPEPIPGGCGGALWVCFLTTSLTEISQEDSAPTLHFSTGFEPHLLLAQVFSSLSLLSLSSSAHHKSMPAVTQAHRHRHKQTQVHTAHTHTHRQAQRNVCGNYKPRSSGVEAKPHIGTYSHQRVCAHTHTHPWTHVHPLYKCTEACISMHCTRDTGINTHRLRPRSLSGNWASSPMLGCSVNHCRRLQTHSHFQGPE